MLEVSLPGHGLVVSDKMVVVDELVALVFPAGAAQSSDVSARSRDDEMGEGGDG